MSRIRVHEWKEADPTELAPCLHCGSEFKLVKTTGRLCVWRDSHEVMPEPKCRVRACEDADAILARVSLLRAYERHECWSRAGRSQTECWCYRAQPDGTSIPCPPPNT